MKKRILIPTILLIAALLMSACGFGMVTGSGVMASETRQVGSFNGITLAGIGDVYVTQGETTSVRIEAEDNLIPYFETSVDGNTLTIGMKPQYAGVSIRPTQPIKFTITTPHLGSITLAGSGNIYVKTIKADSFKVSLLGSGNISTDSLTSTSLGIQLSGSGNVTLDTVTTTDFTSTIAGSGNIQVNTLTAEKVSAKTAGAGNTILSGKAAQESVQILGSGDYRAANLKCDTASVHVTGSGATQVSANSALDVTILGSGDVTYSGSPKVNASIAGSGKVKPANQ